MSKTQVWGGGKKESSIKERRNKETGNQGYRCNKYDKTRPLIIIALRLEVRKLWVLETEKQTSLTCSCLCKWHHKIKSSEITYTHFEVEDMIFKTPQVLQTMYNRNILARAKFQNDRLTGRQGKWGFQFLADFALLMAQNASFRNQGFGRWEKKRKVSCLATDEDEKFKQVIFLMFMCGLRPLAHINIYKSMY